MLCGFRALPPVDGARRACARAPSSLQFDPPIERGARLASTIADLARDRGPDPDPPVEP